MTQRGELPTDKGRLDIRVATEAAGATRQLQSASGRYVLAELAGEWTREAFEYAADEVPPVLKLIDVTTGEVVTTAQGWALGPPTDAGDVMYIEEYEQEYQYRLRSTSRPSVSVALDPPNDLFVVRGAYRAGDHLIAVLYLPQTDFDRLWIASIDPRTLEVGATSVISAALPLRTDFRRLGAGVATAAGRSEVYVLEYPVPGDRQWHVTSLDATTLRQRWRTAIAGTADDPADERNLRNAIVTTSGTGDQIVVAYGKDKQSRTQPERVHVLSAETGRIERSFDAPSEAAFAASHAVPVPGRDAIAMLHMPYTKDQGLWFSSVTVLDTNSGELIDVFDVSRSMLRDRFDEVRDLLPTSILCEADLTIRLAPVDDRFSGRGLHAAAVAGLVQTPADWHRPDRPRVQARQAAIATSSP